MNLRWHAADLKKGQIEQEFEINNVLIEVFEESQGLLNLDLII
jgi:hypothetical protein